MARSKAREALPMRGFEDKLLPVVRAQELVQSRWESLTHLRVSERKMRRAQADVEWWFVRPGLTRTGALGAPW